MIETKSARRHATALPPSIERIIRDINQSEDLKAAQVCRIIREANVSSAELEPWSDFDHSVEDGYGRQMLFEGEDFEVMVMSWRPGDFSAIHDHGYTQWGAVQIFGPAEHATFRIEDGQATTIARWTVKEGDIVGVNHDLLHQMGNPTKDTFFVSLHVYGTAEEVEFVTGDARLLDLQHNKIQRVNGGVFFALDEADIVRTDDGPSADFPTRLRHMTELVRRLLKMKRAGIDRAGGLYSEAVEDFMSDKQRKSFDRVLDELIDEDNHVNNSRQWRILNHELKECASVQNDVLSEAQTSDAFHKYAALYDSLICQPCLDDFMSRYLFFIEEKYGVPFSDSNVISLGCGTGLVEQFMMKELGVHYERMYGIDISEAMVFEARRRIQADVGDVLTLDPSIRMWDIAYSGLNVFQYLDHKSLEMGIKKTASIVRSGGYFIGDFITPDHIRWYPNLVRSTDDQIVSLRTPTLVEENGAVFQASEIINVDFRDEQMRVTNAGRHMRFLPPIHRVRNYFEQAFGSQVDLYDAITLNAIPEWADSCKSTRYFVVARKA